jgi:hypothetical protein
LLLSRTAAVTAALLASTAARADDRVALGYLASRPIAASGSGLAHSVAMRFDRDVTSRIELGVGLELGVSGGAQPLQRLALLPGIALVHKAGSLTWRLEEQIGWQIVRGRLTLDGIPLRGTETRSVRNELAVAVDAPLTEVVDLRVRVGLQIDGIYPVGHASTRLGPFVGISFVVHP